jgi:hypothetical protein
MKLPAVTIQEAGVIIIGTMILIYFVVVGIRNYLRERKLRKKYFE